MRRALIPLVLIAAVAANAAPDPARKAEHQANKIIVKKKDAAGNWQTEREFPLMFANNRKAPRKEKPK